MNPSGGASGRRVADKPNPMNSSDRYLGRDEPERPLATLTHPGHPDGHDQSMAQGLGLLSVKELWVNIHYPATAR
jgi:hypothetical protein